MGLVYIDFLQNGEVAGSMWFNWRELKYEYHVPKERKLPFTRKNKGGAS